jgi:hypothetical protein
MQLLANRAGGRDQRIPVARTGSRRFPSNELSSVRYSVDGRRTAFSHRMSQVGLHLFKLHKDFARMAHKKYAELREAQPAVVTFKQFLANRTLYSRDSLAARRDGAVCTLRSGGQRTTLRAEDDDLYRQQIKTRNVQVHAPRSLAISNQLR